jgi:type IV pilus assembly protein PilE
MIDIKNTVQKGFTLIELLVVIAIIGILAGILFIAINPVEQTNKADDAAVKVALSQIRTQAAVEFAAGGNYSTVCTATNTKTLYDGAVKVGKGKPATVTDCKSYPTAYVAWVETNKSGIFCVDLNGYAGTIPAALTVTDAATAKCK